MSKLVAIVGPTASGKSSLSMKVAEAFGGEIICADSRTIYKGLEIGTAKPSAADQNAVKHHLLDLIEPNQTYSAAEFKLAALGAIESIGDRDKLPILVGGSGLYVYAVLYDYQFPAGARSELRVELEGKPIAELVEQLLLLDPELASTIDLQNPRRVIRAIETAGQPRVKSQLIDGVILVGLRPDGEELAERIGERTKHMIKDGLLDETKAIVEKYGNELEVLRSPGYEEMVEHIGGKITLDEAEDLINLHTRQLAKRQLTWFKRNQDIHWFEDVDLAYDYIADQLRV